MNGNSAAAPEARLDRRGVDDEAVAHVAGQHALVCLVDVVGAITSISGVTPCSAQKSSISWVSAMPPIIEPDRLRRMPIKRQRRHLHRMFGHAEFDQRAVELQETEVGAQVEIAPTRC